MSDDNPTLPYPETGGEHPTLALPRDAAAVPRARRRRWPWVVLVVVVLLAALAVAGEVLARSIVPGAVRTAVIGQLDLPADQQLDVETSGLLLPQLIAGRLDSLRVSTDSVTLQGITGAVEVTATGVSLSGDELGGATGTVRIDETQFAGLLSASDLPIESVSLDAPDATVNGSVTVLGMSLPVSLTVTPAVTEGDLELTPGTLAVGGVVLDAAEVRSRLGALGESLTQAQRICIADRLPAGVTLTALTIEGSEAVVDIDVAGEILSDPSLREKGTCPGS